MHIAREPIHVLFGSSCMDPNTRLRVPKIAFIYGGSTSSATMIALQHDATLQLEYCALERN